MDNNEFSSQLKNNWMQTLFLQCSHWIYMNLSFIKQIEELKHYRYSWIVFPRSSLKTINRRLQLIISKNLRNAL